MKRRAGRRGATARAAKEPARGVGSARAAPRPSTRGAAPPGTTTPDTGEVPTDVPVGPSVTAWSPPGRAAAARALLACALASPWSSVAGTARAAEAKSPAHHDDASPDDSAVERRLLALEARVAQWRAAWGWTFGSLTALQLGGAFVLPPGHRTDAAVGAAKSGLGLLSTLLRPSELLGAGAELSRLPAHDTAARARRRARALALLEAAREEERLMRSWVPRAGAVLVNLAGTYYLWLAHERHASGWLALGAGLVVSELQLRTYPREGPYGSTATTSRLRVQLLPRGVAVTGAF